LSDHLFALWRGRLFACLRKLLIEFAAMRRASSRVSRLVAERRCGSSSK
jgi:hypothetical protein